MPSGFIPSKRRRRAALRQALKELRAAVRVLEKLEEDPDKDLHMLELAEEHITRARGQRGGAFVDVGLPIGLTDLLEHYFS
jgi:hypothetical protein